MNNISVWERVSLARMSTRPTSKFYIESILDSFHEFHGDRFYGNDEALVCGVGYVENYPVTVIAQMKGENTKENIARNFGMLNPEGYRKALRLMFQANKFRRPIITFVDTPGAFCGKQAEERGQGEAIAKNLFEMMGLDVPILSIVISEGGSGGALGVAVANEVWMLENAIYSVISPEGCASILWNNASRVKEAAEVLKLTSYDLYDMNIIDKIIDELGEGAHVNKYEIAENMKLEIIDFINRYKGKSADEIKEQRYNKFREIGKYGIG